MKNSSTEIVKIQCINYFPQIEEIINHKSAITNSTWDQGLETGKAIELLALCSTSNSLIKNGFEPIIPDLYFQNPDLFYLRNVFPRHHDGQAGHDVTCENEIPLYLRFLSAITPRVIFRKDGIDDLLLFREGYPIHQIIHYSKTGQIYLDRPDIVICKGTIHTELINKEELIIEYIQNSNQINVKIRIINHPKIPIISLNSSENFQPSLVGIIECSYSKNVRHAIKQLEQYRNLFSLNNQCTSLLINGKNKITGVYDYEIILNHSNLDLLHNSISTTINEFTKKITSH